MKKILVISSSPRKGGNSDILCDEFVKGAREAGNQVMKICLADKKIGYCTGCYACQSNGKCVIKDDAEEILQAMMASDVLVFASPVYFYSICAQLKALFDRSVAFYPNIRNKEYYFLMTMGDGNAAMAEGTIKAMQGFLDCYEGSKLMGTLCAPGVYTKGDVKSTKYPKLAYELGLTVK